MLSFDKKIIVEPDVAAKGIKIKAAIFSVSEIVRNQGSPLKNKIKEIIISLNTNELLKSPIIEESKKLHLESGIKDTLAPAEWLLKLIQKSGKIPNINRVVDIYNIVSAQTQLSIGAHDLSKIQGNIILKITDGTERFIPLMKNELEKINPKEYAAVDNEKVLCRMDLKQSNESKIDETTKNFLIYVQGNAATTKEYVSNALEQICDYIRTYMAEYLEECVIL